MSKKLAMRYGNPSEAQTPDWLDYYGVIDTDDPVELTLDEGGIYNLYTLEYRVDTGAIRGYRQMMIVVPVGDSYGTTSVGHQSMASSTNTGVTVTYESDSTITLARSSSSYEVRYAIQKIY